MKIKFLFLSIVLFASIGFAQTLQRGPYLQINASTSIVIRWDTDSLTDSKVEYGTDLNNLSSVETSNDLVKKHAVKLTGLDPSTVYYYNVGSSSQVFATAHSKQYFKTAPLPGAAEPVRVWAIGDFGKGNQGQKDVRDSYLNYLGDDKETDVWIWLGDNAYNDGSEEEYTNKVFDTDAYKDMFIHTPFWPCPGNHDYHSVCPIPCNDDPDNHAGVYYDIVSVPEQGEAGGTPSGLPLYYSFDYANVHFMSLNSELGSNTVNFDWIGAFDVAGWNNSPMKAWIEEDLSQNTQPWVVAYWHQLPFSKGSHDSDDFWELYMKAMRENVIPLLESYNVDLIVCGHSHVYERSYLMNGFYGNTNEFDASQHVLDGSSGNDDLGEAYQKDITKTDGNKGTVYVVVGNSGSKTSDPDLNHPIMYASDGGDDAYGSVVLEFNGDRLDAFYLKSDSTVGDKFSIVKKGVVGVENIKSEAKINKLNVFPHPFTDVANVYYHLDEKTDIQIDLLDMTGKRITTVFEGTLNAGPQNHFIYPDKLGMKKGIYLLSVNDGKDTRFKKLVKVE